MLYSKGTVLDVWTKGCALGYQFHREVPIDNYIVDFYCHELMLCIEIDGNSHEIETVIEHDIIRQEKLQGSGVRFIGINDRDIKRDMQNVIRSIAGMTGQLTNE